MSDLSAGEKRHTPGPWRFEESKGGAWFVYGETGDTQPIKPKIRVPKRGTKLMIANAHLIAAAPELLEALEAMIELETHTHRLPESFNQNFRDGCVDDAKAVIAKAKGR